MEHLFLSCIESRVENNRNLYGRFQLGPFERGQGLTVANALRRTLLSELSGLAIFCVEIQGVSHEYSNLKGARESVLDILLNLKQVVFVTDKKFSQPEMGFLKIQGPVIIKACHLKLPTWIQCVDPDQYIATLVDDGVIQMKFMICEGKNFLVQTPVGIIEETFRSHFTNIQLKKNNLNSQTSFDKLPENTNFKKNTSQLKPPKMQRISETFQLERSSSLSPSLNLSRLTVPSNLSLIESVAKKRRSINTTNNKLTKKKKILKNKVNFKKFEKNLVVQKQKIAEFKLNSSSNTDYSEFFTIHPFTNVLLIDAIFMPVTKVNYLIQNIDKYSKDNQSNVLQKFKQNSFKEKVILEVWTNGSIQPRHAIQKAVYRIIDMFNSLSKPILM